MGPILTAKLFPQELPRLYKFRRSSKQHE